MKKSDVVKVVLAVVLSLIFGALIFYFMFEYEPELRQNEHEAAVQSVINSMEG